MKACEWLNLNKAVFSESDLRFLIKKVLNCDSLGQLAIDDIYLDAIALSGLNAIKTLYLKGMPLAYILGQEEFFGLSFDIDHCVLIPRKETELVVEKAIEIINRQESMSMLDLCCGSANIAVSLAKEVGRPMHIYASDLSQQALRVAGRNLLSHKITAQLVCSDLFSSFAQKSFDVIVSNPPYVETHNIKGSLCYEPKAALDGGSDGLTIIRRIISEAHSYLNDNGYLIMECGFSQHQAINALVVSCGRYTIQEWVKDYSGHYRAIVLKKRSYYG